MAASGGGRTEMVKLLLDKGANVEARSDDGTTALQLAVSNGNTEVVKLLREKGAK
jgi:ankyrin repeat protein